MRKRTVGYVRPTKIQNTLQSRYNTIRYNTILDITRFKDGSKNV